MAVTPATAAPTATSGTSAPPPLLFVRWDHLLLAMDIVAFLAQEPDQRGFSARAINGFIWERLGWRPRRDEVYDLFTQLIGAFRDLWAQRRPQGIEDNYNVTLFFEHLHLLPKSRPGERTAESFERLLHAIVTSEVTEAGLTES